MISCLTNKEPQRTILELSVIVGERFSNQRPSFEVVKRRQKFFVRVVDLII